jgi:hypothetical protein
MKKAQPYIFSFFGGVGFILLLSLLLDLPGWWMKFTHATLPTPVQIMDGVYDCSSTHSYGVICTDGTTIIVQTIDSYRVLVEVSNQDSAGNVLVKNAGSSAGDAPIKVVYILGPRTGNVTSLSISPNQSVIITADSVFKSYKNAKYPLPPGPMEGTVVITVGSEKIKVPWKEPWPRKS